MAAVSGCGGGSPQTTSPSTGGGPPQTTGAHQAPGLGNGVGGVRLEKLGDFDRPLYVTQPPGDSHHLFVVEQTGRVQVLTDGTREATPFLDLSDQVSCCGEQGLLSIAFAPDYRRSGLVYADYTDRSGDTRVVEYRRSSSDPLTVDPSSARLVLHVNQPYPNHNGGLVLFGPDDLLYIGLGDGGSEGDPDRRGQDLGTLLGKILRIDPRPSGGRPYSVPRSNPFIHRAGARPEIYSFGLRNPWRFSFDRRDQDFALADVGQNRWEEIDLLPVGAGPGVNYGWSAFEGFARFNDDQTAPHPVRPTLVYSHHNGNCSVTGGYVVRDRSLTSLYGRYLYGDFCAGDLRSFPAVLGVPAKHDRALGLNVPSLSSFGEDDAGHIYATSLDGPVYRLVPSG